MFTEKADWKKATDTKYIHTGAFWQEERGTRCENAFFALK